MTETVNHVDTDTGRERRGRLLPHEAQKYKRDRRRCQCGGMAAGAVDSCQRQGHWGRGESNPRPRQRKAGWISIR